MSNSISSKLHGNVILSRRAVYGRPCRDFITADVSGFEPLPPARVKDPSLTPSQLVLQNDYGVDFSYIWRNIKVSGCSCKVRSVVFQFFAKCLPLFHSQKASHPSTESSMGIFFGSAASRLQPLISHFFSSLLGFDVPWTPPSVLPLVPVLHVLQPTVTCCIFWGLWQWRNWLKHGPVPTSAHFFHTVLRELVFSLNNLPSNLALSSPVVSRAANQTLILNVLFIILGARI